MRKTCPKELADDLLDALYRYRRGLYVKPNPRLPRRFKSNKHKAQWHSEGTRKQGEFVIERYRNWVKRHER